MIMLHRYWHQQSDARLFQPEIFQEFRKTAVLFKIQLSKMKPFVHIKVQWNDIENSLVI